MDKGGSVCIWVPARWMSWVYGVWVPTMQVGLSEWYMGSCPGVDEFACTVHRCLSWRWVCVYGAWVPIMWMDLCVRCVVSVPIVQMGLDVWHGCVSA